MLHFTGTGAENNTNGKETVGVAQQLVTFFISRQKESKASQDKARQDKARQGKTRQGVAVKAN